MAQALVHLGCYFCMEDCVVTVTGESCDDPDCPNGCTPDGSRFRMATSAEVNPEFAAWYARHVAPFTFGVVQRLKT